MSLDSTKACIYFSILTQKSQVLVFWSYLEHFEPSYKISTNLYQLQLKALTASFIYDQAHRRYIKFL